jgi:hypothetical protein
MRNRGTTPKSVNDLTELNPADPAADFLLLWDTSAASSRKVKPNNLGLAGGSGPTRGTATLNFGAAPGKTHATVAVTGQTGILAGSIVRAWLMPAATADHNADEHILADIRIIAGPPTAGVGFTIHGLDISPPPTRNPDLSFPVSRFRSAAATVYGLIQSNKQGAVPRTWGQWNVAWEWV